MYKITGALLQLMMRLADMGRNAGELLGVQGLPQIGLCSSTLLTIGTQNYNVHQLS